MGLRELKETAHQQYVRGKFAQCAKTYQQVLQLAPRDPNMRVRHAEACRRAGERLQAIASYRVAANLLLELGCETRARGALKAALELDPNDPVLQEDVASLERQVSPEENTASGATERGELPLLPPLDSGMEPVPPPPAAMHEMMRRSATPRQQTLPPIHRALPAAPSVPPVVPPVLLPAPGMRSAAPASHTLPPISRTRPPTPAPIPGQSAAPVPPPRLATTGALPQTARPAGGLTPRSGTAGLPPPVLHPVATPATAAADLQPPVLQPARTLTPAQGLVTSGPRTPPPLPPRSVTGGFQVPAASAATPNPRAASPVSGKVLVPPPPPAEALGEEGHGGTSVAPQPPVHMTGASSRLEVRRLSPNVLAFRDSPLDSWALIHSRTPLEMHVVEDLERLPPELSDFTLDISVEPVGESASSTMH